MTSSVFMKYRREGVLFQSCRRCRSTVASSRLEGWTDEQ